MDGLSELRRCRGDDLPCQAFSMRTISDDQRGHQLFTSRRTGLDRHERAGREPLVGSCSDQDSLLVFDCCGLVEQIVDLHPIPGGLEDLTRVRLEDDALAQPEAEDINFVVVFQW